MNPQLKTKKIDMYIHGDIRDGVDVKKPKSISRIIDGPQKVKKKMYPWHYAGCPQSHFLPVDNVSEALEHESRKKWE